MSTTRHLHGGYRWSYQACIVNIDACSRHVHVTVAGRPDLIVDGETRYPHLGPSTPFTLSVTVRNQGTAAVRERPILRTYLSSNRRLDRVVEDPLVSTDRVPPVGTGDERTVAARLLTPDQPGEWYYFSCVDAVSGESRTGNNCNRGVLMRVSDRN